MKTGETLILKMNIYTEKIVAYCFS